MEQAFFAGGSGCFGILVERFEMPDPQSRPAL